MKIQEGIQLKEHTTFHIGGPADYFVSVASVNELKEAITFAQERSLPITMLGGGSNMLVSDDGIRGLVIHVGILGMEYESIPPHDAIVHVGAGVMLDELVRDTVARGYWGLENLSAIPGTVGATPIQNVGAYGVEVASRISSVTALHKTSGEERVFTLSECAFGYRSSFFKTEAGKEFVITNVSFKLTKIPTPHLHYADLVRFFGDADPSQKEIRDAVIRIRSKKFPDWNVIGTAGSFFKNPFISKEAFNALRIKLPELLGYENKDGTMKIPLGWILDKVLHVRGVRVGEVGTYEGQSLVILNYGGATARDVDAFASDIEKKVYDATGVHIEREVRRY